MEITKTIENGLEDIPSREIYYFGPKLVSCCLKKIIEHKKYIFELYDYSIKGNGCYYLKIYNSDNKQIFEKLTIRLDYAWAGLYKIEFSNNSSPISNSYFNFQTKPEIDLESVFNKLVLIAERMEKFKKDYPSFQYVYVYIIFLFFQNKKEQIKASEYSYKYNILKKMESCITSELTDNVNNRYFSKDTIYYKVFDRFLNKELDKLKNKPIHFD
jgi:hypothetical protein